MHRKPRVPSIAPLHPIPKTLAEMPTYMMVQLTRLAYSYRGAVAPFITAPNEPLRLPHFAALVTLEDAGAISQTELSQRLRFDASDLVSLIDELEQQGFVARQRDDKDRRRYRLHITSSGQAKLKERKADADAMTAMFFAALNPEEFKQFSEMLERVEAYNREHYDENVQELVRKINQRQR